MCREPLSGHAVTSRIDYEVLAVDEAEPPQLVEQREMMRRVAWTGVQAADAISPPGFLRSRRERPRDCRAAEQHDERAALGPASGAMIAICTRCCYGRSLSISALSAASIVRYCASRAITRDPASAIQPVWPTRSISAHCSESSRAPRIELVPLIICAARRMLGTSARAAASRSADRTDGV